MSEPFYDVPPATVGGPDPATRVQQPATGLIVTAVVGLILHSAMLLLHLLGIGIVSQVGVPDADEQQVFEFFAQATTGVCQSVIGIVVAIVILLGAQKMKQLEAYGFALTSAILAMIPCISPCCLVGLPYGIWSIVVLSESQVKHAFRS